MLVASVLACLAVCGVGLLPACCEAGSINIPAWTFDRGNAKVFANPYMYADYRDKYPQIVAGEGGELPWVIEYDLNIPADADYKLEVHYGSPEPRPLEVWLDDKKVGTCCGGVTGNTAPFPDRHPLHARPRDEAGFHGLEWEEGCTVAATKGKHTLKLTSQGPPPNLYALRLTAEVEFPKDWKPAPRNPKVGSMAALQRRLFLPPGAVNIASLRLALEDMIVELGSRYPGGPEYLKKLAELEKQQDAVKEGTPEQKQPIEDALKALQREAMLAHPSLKFDKLLFLKQVHVGCSIYTEHLSRTPGGGNICVLSPVAPDGKVTELVPELSGGRFGRFSLSFDATKIVFCHAKPEQRFRIYEIDIDPKSGQRVPGKEVRQLTFSNDLEAKTMKLYEGKFCGNGYDDVDPCYTPDGRIMFVSTRAHRAVLCRAVTATTLHVMEGDGSNLRCISGGQVNELAPGVLDDGRVVYPRWEYVDKGFANAVSLWTVRPDGSGTEHVYKNTCVLPCAMIDTRSIPGSQRIITVGAGHHGGLEGPVILVDNRLNRRDSMGMTNLTPEISYPGMFPTRGKGGAGKFRHPYPFSEKFYLISHNAPTSEEKRRFSIHMFDAWGNRSELYKDPDISCFLPVPLRPQRMPTRISSVARREKRDSNGGEYDPESLATVFLQDVYRGLKGVERGRVKYLRVMEAQILPWELAANARGMGQQLSVVSLGADPALKKIHGIVKVHEDGSAFFTAPAEKNLFFQALDENFMELQRMRTFVNLMPGEKKSCVGCHEVRRLSPALKQSNPMALDHEVQHLQPQPGHSGPHIVCYPEDVQPVLDRNCLGCHSGENPKGDLDLSGKPTDIFNVSYENLCKKRLVSYLEGGFGSANLPAELPMTFGSHQSKLTERIMSDPCKSNLTREEFIKIVTWIDSNVVYYGSHKR